MLDLRVKKTLWHGFDRYDFLMDEKTLVLKPIKAAEDEKCEINEDMNKFRQVEGQRRCLVVVPKVPAPGNPWSWRGYYFGHEIQTEVELLKLGFHICYVYSNPGASIPLMHVYGSLDPWLKDQTRVVEKLYKKLGGQIKVILKEGEGHYSLAPKDTKPVVDFITQKAK